jgi:hypothetical protein
MNPVRNAAGAMAACSTREVQMRATQIVVTASATFMLAAALTMSPALALKRITLAGSYSRATVKKDCESAGAQYDNYKNGSYGCVNVNNGNAVNCVKGKCTGTVVSSRMRPPHTLAGLLHSPHASDKYSGVNSPPKRGVHPVRVESFKTKTDFGRSTGPTNPNSDVHRRITR